MGESTYITHYDFFSCTPRIRIAACVHPAGHSRNPFKSPTRDTRAFSHVTDRSDRIDRTKTAIFSKRRHRPLKKYIRKFLGLRRIPFNKNAEGGSGGTKGKV